MRNDWRQKKLLITIGQKEKKPQCLNREKMKCCFVALKNWNYSYLDALLLLYICNGKT